MSFLNWVRFLSLSVMVIFVIACGGETTQETPDIEATVEARVQAELAKESTESSKVKGLVNPTLSSPTPISTPTPKPSPTPVLPSSASLLKISKDVMASLDSFHYDVQMQIKAGDFELPMSYKGRFEAPESLHETLSAKMLGLNITVDFIKIDDTYFEKEFMGEWSTTYEFNGLDPRNFWLDEDNLMDLPIASAPTKMEVKDNDVYKINWNLSDMEGGLPSSLLSILDIAGDDMPDNMLVEFWIDTESSYLRKFSVTMEGDANDMDLSEFPFPLESDNVTITMELQFFDFNEHVEPIVSPLNTEPQVLPAPAAPAAPAAADDAADDAYQRGLVRQKSGQHLEAVAEFSWAIELNSDIGMYYFRRAISYKEIDKIQKALDDSSMAINLDHNEAAPYNLRGHIYQLLGQHEESIPDFDSAIRLNPNIAFYYRNRGAAHREVGDLEDAILDLNKAIELDPGRASAYHHRSLTYEKLNELNLSKIDLEKACELDNQFCESSLSLSAELPREGITDRGCSFTKLGDISGLIKNPLTFNGEISLNSPCQEWVFEAQEGELLRFVIYPASGSEINFGHVMVELSLSNEESPGTGDSVVVAKDNNLRGVVLPNSGLYTLLVEANLGATSGAYHIDVLKSFDTSSSVPQVLELKHRDNKAYTGFYFFDAIFNDSPVWKNYQCSAAGQLGLELGHEEGCYIFRWNKDKWVLQPLPPSDEWLANSVIEGTWPWEGVLGDNVLSINLYSILIKTANEIELQPISCPEIEILKSRSSSKSVSLRFYLNSSSGLFKDGTDEIGVFWRNAEGKEILYHTIRTVGGGFDVSTYPGHPWVVRRINSNIPGECVMGFIIEGNDSYSDQVDFIAEINL